MPRDGSGIYSIPPGTQGTPNTTIESAKYNSFAADLETDLNAARPIIAGGTGGNSASAARAALAAERSMQAVTNFDTQVWEPGSFYSAAGATSAPVAGHAFAGIVYGPDANNMVIEARDLNDASTPGLKFVKEKTAGVWAPAWTVESSDKVAKAGDTMTGPLILAADPTVPLGAMTKQYFDNGAVRYEIAQALTALQKDQARANVYAAPLDTIGYYGLQLNGAMDVAQDYLGAAVNCIAGDNGRPCDQWTFTNAGTQTMQVQQSQYQGVKRGGVQKMLTVITNVGQAVGASNFFMLTHPLEGYRAARLSWGLGGGGVPLTICFLIAATAPGQAALAIRSGDATRSYVAPFNVTGGLTQDFITITIPPDNGVSNWPVGAVLGLQFGIVFGCGATYQTASPNTWINGSAIALPTTTNFFAATNNQLYVTAFGAYPGNVAPANMTEYARGMRDYGMELPLCKRFLQKLSDLMITNFGPLTPYSSTNAFGRVCELDEMRVAPTITVSSLSHLSLTNPNSGYVTVGSGTFTGLKRHIYTGNLGAPGAALLQGGGTNLQFNQAGWIKADAGMF